MKTVEAPILCNAAILKTPMNYLGYTPAIQTSLEYIWYNNKPSASSGFLKSKGSWKVHTVNWKIFVI